MFRQSKYWWTAILAMTCSLNLNAQIEDSELLEQMLQVGQPPLSDPPPTGGEPNPPNDPKPDPEDSEIQEEPVVVGPSCSPFVDPCEKANAVCGDLALDTGLNSLEQLFGTMGVAGCSAMTGINLGGIALNGVGSIYDLVKNAGCGIIACIPPVSPLNCAAKLLCSAGTFVADKFMCDTLTAECEDYKYTGSPVLNIAENLEEMHRCPDSFNKEFNPCIPKAGGGHNRLSTGQISNLCNQAAQSQGLNKKVFGACVAKCVKASESKYCFAEECNMSAAFCNASSGACSKAPHKNTPGCFDKCMSCQLSFPEDEIPVIVGPMAQ